MTGTGLPEPMFDHLVEFVASDRYRMLTVASMPIMLVWYVIRMRQEAAARLRRWRDCGDQAAMPFHARLAKGLRRIDGLDG